MSDAFFSELSNTKPYLKLAFEGFAGSGKTYTMAQIAAGLHKRIGSTKPIVMFDTEESAKFLVRYFDGLGIRVLHKRSRSLADLIETMHRCRDGASDVLLIDSITHVWENFVESYKQKKGRKSGRLEFQDWGIIKPTWKGDFSDPFVRDPYHCLMTGRAGFEYEQDTHTDEDGRTRKEIVKSGIKMKVEGETAYEPDLLVLMERREDVIGKGEKKVWREATIIKDRSTLIDGKTFRFSGEDPPGHTYEQFAPALEYILEKPVAQVVTEKSAADLFETEEDRRNFFAQRDILLEKIQGEMVSAWPGVSAPEKKAKADALFASFTTRSWTEVSKMGIDRLTVGLDRMVAIARKASGHADVVRQVPELGTTGEVAPAAAEADPLPAGWS